jgi:hypothetical protein
MKTDFLIEKLSQSNRPVQRLSSPSVSFAKWVVVSFFCVGIGASLFGIRTDLEEVVFQYGFTSQVFCSLGLALLSALSAFILSVPDKEKTWVSVLPIATLVLWFISISQSFYVVDFVNGGIGLSCIRDIVVLSFIPTVVLFLMLRRAAPLQKGRVGVFAGLSVAALGAVGTQFICHNDDPLHVIMWHYIPVLGIGFLGFWLGKFLLKWQK